MEATFTQKVLLVLILSLVAAVGIQAFRLFVLEARDSMDTGIRMRTTIESR